MTPWSQEISMGLHDEHCHGYCLTWSQNEIAIIPSTPVGNVWVRTIPRNDLMSHACFNEVPSRCLLKSFQKEVIEKPLAMSCLYSWDRDQESSSRTRTTIKGWVSICVFACRSCRPIQTLLFEFADLPKRADVEISWSNDVVLIFAYLLNQI